MIIGLWNLGSGMGDQTFAYLATRVRAEDLGVPFGMIGEFKGAFFMNIDRGEPVNLKYHIEMPAGAIVIDEPHKLFKVDTPYFNPEFNFIEDGTVIDGCSAQDERYWEHRLNEIREWLKVEPLEVLDETWIVNVRGGEYRTVPELILPKEYWQEASNGKFIDVHTDDPEYAKELFPQSVPIKDIGLNWRALRYAKKAIISNSAFAIIPRLLSGGETIAPKYWLRNTGKWRPMNYYKKFTYV